MSKLKLSEKMKIKSKYKFGFEIPKFNPSFGEFKMMKVILIVVH